MVTIMQFALYSF